MSHRERECIRIKSVPGTGMGMNKGTRDVSLHFFKFSLTFLRTYYNEQHKWFLSQSKEGTFVRFLVLSLRSSCIAKEYVFECMVWAGIGNAKNRSQDLEHVGMLCH